jgi:hypothetical protein
LKFYDGFRKWLDEKYPIIDTINWDELLEADSAFDYTSGNGVIQHSPDIGDPINYVVVNTDRPDIEDIFNDTTEPDLEAED